MSLLILAMLAAIPLGIVSVVFLVSASRIEKLRLRRTDTPRRAIFAEWQTAEKKRLSTIAAAAGIWAGLSFLPFGFVLGLAIFALMLRDAFRHARTARLALDELGVSRLDALAKRVEFE